MLLAEPDDMNNIVEAFARVKRHAGEFPNHKAARNGARDPARPVGSFTVPTGFRSMDSLACWTPHRGAVSLTFDDGRQSQPERAMPAMDRLRLRGTFYSNPSGDDWRGRLAPWSEVASAEHEIGNHSLSHVCSSNLFGRSGGLEDRSTDNVEADILAAQERLRDIAPHQSHWTFAYPCYQTFVGRGATRQSYVPVVARHFLCGRAGGEHGFANYPGLVDLACAHGLTTDRMSGFEMIGLVEALATKGQWVILVFHDIDGSRLTVGEYDFSLLLEYLARRADEVWTAPVAEVARKVADFQSSQSEQPGRP